ncbi:MAG: response regulator [Anaerolineae bacterium]|nr:response regulator [Candidatus Roseilinea sp.]MDW8450745.1 response regulator [Anaerolineae bacterium]
MIAKTSASEKVVADLDRAALLREILIKAIESLKPINEHEGSSKEWRQFTILHDRYVLHRSLWQVQQKLHLGERQVRRDHRRALARLAVLLETEIARLTSEMAYAAGERPAQSSAIAVDRLSADSQEAEMIRAAQRLMPEPSVFGVNELLNDLRAILFEVARHSDRINTISWSVHPPNLTIYADRGILHQLLLKLLQALVEHAQPSMPTISVIAHVDKASRVRLAIQGQFEITDSVKLAQPELPPLCRWLARALQTDLQSHTEAAGLYTIALELPAGTRLRKILIIDDEPIATELFRSYLAGMDYHVVTLTRGSDALERARDVQPDAIVLDVMMPAMDGWELLQRLRHDPVLQSVPIVICSVLRDAELALALGAAAFLHKPVLRQQLLATLAKVLSR